MVETAGMVETLEHNWWAILIRGIAAIVFGIIALWHPFWAGFALVILFGAYAFVDGVFAIVAAIAAARIGARWWPFVIEGIVGLVVAAIAFFAPGITGLALYWTIAAWAIITGIFEIMAAFRLREVVQNEWFLILGGVASVIFGVLLFVWPATGVITVIWLIGIYALLFGVLLIGLAMRLRQRGTVAAT
jgi:uncharacterized membrane protein HdeD (DUF308 family)